MSPKCPTDDALWMRRNLTWVEIAEEYNMDSDWLAHRASRKGFMRDPGGNLLTAPCKQCGAKRSRSELEPYRECELCRNTKNRHEAWWSEYEAARNSYLTKIAALGYQRGDLIDPNPLSP